MLFRSVQDGCLYPIRGRDASSSALAGGWGGYHTHTSSKGGENMDQTRPDSTLELTSKMLDLISDGKLSELEAERLLNATSRLVAGVPTGTAPQTVTKTVK